MLGIKEAALGLADILTRLVVVVLIAQLADVNQQSSAFLDGLCTLCSSSE